MDEERLQIRYQDTIDKVWKEVVEYFGMEEFKARSIRNKKSHAQQIESVVEIISDQLEEREEKGDSVTQITRDQAFRMMVGEKSGYIRGQE
ncbi:conserved hypothetical protein [Ricinus communis]|uniref:Uncharacterized protein n=1 Tax=Ricinus communis TaxID=3988 RepID=B9S312_RICCO|nr:conserved hypothetical protein [Ricinus communis]